MLRLSDPHPFIYNRRSILITGLSTFLLIAIFAPFGFRELAPGNRLLFALTFGLLSALSVVLVVNGSRKLFPAYMQEDTWTVGKEIGLFVSVIATICLFIFISFVLFGLSGAPIARVFTQVVLYTMSISLVPVVILVLYEQYSFHKQSVRQALALTQGLSEGSTSTPAGGQPMDTVLLEAENGKIELQVAADQILYLKADGNYVEVFYLDQHRHIQKKLIRNRLKSLSEALPPNQFFPSHKSYIANAKQIEQVKGNARNFELVMHHTDVCVPVSRSRSKELAAFLQALY
jgi:DNA-binding LytR/AlgR family response regulator